MKNLIPAFFAVGAVMSLAGALIYITKWPLAPYIFMVGSILVAIAQNTANKCLEPYYWWPQGL